MTTLAPVLRHDTAALRAQYEHAQGWAEFGYAETSRAYWTGMRDTLAVILGITTAVPRTSGPGCDAAAIAMIPTCLPLTNAAERTPR